MTASFRPRLVNDRFGDPGVFIEIAHERETVLLDMGDLTALSARDLLRIGAIGVSHMHIDHLIGFDRLLRVNVGREAVVRVIGPEAVAQRIGHKLQAYSWDLVARYKTELVFEVGELVAPERKRCWRFRLSRGFEAEFAGEQPVDHGIVIETPRWRMAAAILEHHGPCLGFAVEEPRRVNVWPNRLAERGLEAGPWLNALKQAVRGDAPDTAEVALPGGASAPLSSLRDLLSVAPGMKIGYVTDVRDTPANREVIARLCRGADTLFIEAAFAAGDAGLASERAHLTTRAAGEIARSARARRVEPFHFSPRYEAREDEHLAEVRAAFAGEGQGR